MPREESEADEGADEGRVQRPELMSEVKGRWEAIERQVERTFEDLVLTEEDRPFSLGVRVEAGRYGQPRIRPFGHVARDLDTLREGWRSPELSINHEEQGVLRVRAAVPGVGKEDVHVQVGDHSVEISAESEDVRYHELYQTSSDLLPDSARARYRNGMLELTVHKRESTSGERDVEVE